MISSIPLLVSLLGCWSMVNAHDTRTTEDPLLEHRSVQELLVPLHSITPLMCDPIFNQASSATATWFRNGETIAKVSSLSNHIYEDRPLELKEVPEVGLLIIPRVKLEDQGDYWCTRDDHVNIDKTKIYRLRVAYIREFDEEQIPIAEPSSQPIYGQTVTVTCPPIESYPKAVVAWKFNDEAVDFSSGRIEVSPKGSLIIRRFLTADAGVYACTWSNFAGHSTTQTELPPPLLYPLGHDMFDYVSLSSSTVCSSYFRSGLLWFLIGCLSTSCVVLIYLLGGLVYYRSSSRRRRSFSALDSILRADPNLAPGFRKVVAPMHDYVQDAPGNGFMENV